jgi:DNA-directed RNA polymerase sigma subunit (sigma70/sigma32)
MLTEIEEIVLIAHFKYNYTFNQIARAYDSNRKRVKYIHDKALKKLALEYLKIGKLLNNDEKISFIKEKLQEAKGVEAV